MFLKKSYICNNITGFVIFYLKEYIKYTDRTSKKTLLKVDVLLFIF